MIPQSHSQPFGRMLAGDVPSILPSFPGHSSNLETNLAFLFTWTLSAYLHLQAHSCSFVLMPRNTLYLGTQCPHWPGKQVGQLQPLSYPLLQFPQSHLQPYNRSPAGDSPSNLPPFPRDSTKTCGKPSLPPSSTPLLIHLFPLSASKTLKIFLPGTCRSYSWQGFK